MLDADDKPAMPLGSGGKLLSRLEVDGELIWQQADLSRSMCSSHQMARILWRGIEPQTGQMTLLFE